VGGWEVKGRNRKKRKSKGRREGIRYDTIR